MWNSQVRLDEVDVVEFFKRVLRIYRKFATELLVEIDALSSERHQALPIHHCHDQRSVHSFPFSAYN